jgi:PEP-CTERM motif-containing protein
VTSLIRRASTPILVVLALFACSGNLVHAGAVLHVDTGNDVNHQAKGIPTVLSGDGHTVTSITAQAAAFSALQGTLTGVYDLVIWDNWSNSSGAEVVNVTSYVNAGGTLLYIGYDSIFGPGQAALLGGSSPSDTTSAGDELNAVANVSNSLTTGLVDIRGLTPSGVAASGNPDLDSNNNLNGNTAAVVTSTYGNHWTLHSLGLGEAIFMSTPYDFNFQTDDTVYRDALRNVAFNADPSAVPEPGTVALFGIGLVGVGLATVRRKRNKRA